MKFETGKTNRLGNRNINQDRFAIIERPSAILLLLADGMGGYKGGEFAANMFILKMIEAFNNTSMPIQDIDTFFNNAFEYAHLSIIDIGNQQTPPIQPRSTGVACLIQNGSATWAHVGDSRVYLFRNNQLFTRTRDHSTVEELIQKGDLKEEKRLSHPKLNQVTRCVGGMKKSVQVSIGDSTRLQADDCILLCSDGLWSSLTDDQMIKQLNTKQTLINKLLEMSEAAEIAAYPKSDNISAIAFKFISDDEELSPLTEENNEPSPETAQANLMLDEIQQALDKLDKKIKD